MSETASQSGGFTIRPMEVRDHAACSALWERTEYLGRVLDLESFGCFLDYNRGFSQVAVNDAGQIVATVLASHDGRTGHLQRLAVDRGCRGSGLGKRIVTAAEKALAHAGVKHVHLIVLPDNTGGLNFWQKCGYEEHPELIFMHRDLIGERHARPH